MNKHRVFEDKSTWNGSSWRDVGPKYCKHCNKIIKLGSTVRYSYGNRYSNRGLHHLRCANKIEKEANETRNALYQQRIREEKLNEKKPIVIPNSPPISAFAEAFNVSFAAIQKCLCNQRTSRNKNIFEIVREVALKSGYHKDENNIIHFPDRYVLRICPVLGEEKVFNKKPYFISLTDESQYIKKSLGNGLYAFLYRPIHYLEKEDNLNYRVSYWAKEKIYGPAIVCSSEDFEDLFNEGNLAPLPIPKDAKSMIPRRVKFRGSLR